MAGAQQINETRINAWTDASRTRVDVVAELPAGQARVFQALASDEILTWWVRPGVFDTRQWQGDVRQAGKWEASGVGKMGPYALEGEFIEIDAPRRLVHTWKPKGAPVEPMIVTYDLEKSAGGTRLTLSQTGFQSPDVCMATAAGWETSFQRLAEIVSR